MWQFIVNDCAKFVFVRATDLRAESRKSGDDFLVDADAEGQPV
jgi:hypothetical protein